MHEEPVRVPVRCEAAISRRGFVVCAGVLMSPMGTYAAASLPPADRPDARLLQRDIDILQSAYERLHPGLYRYNSPAQISAGFDVLRQEMLSLPAQGPWLDRAYLAFARFAAKVRCGHAYANFYNQSDAVRKALFERGDKLPAEFRWIDSRMLVTRDLSHEQVLPPGTFIVAVNGVPVDVLLLRLLAVARADGSNDAKRVAQMELQGIDRHEAFDVYLPLVAPGGEGKIELEVRQPQRLRRDRLAVRPLTYEERLAARRVSPRDERAGWTFDSGDAAFAMLKMPNWALYDSKWDWKAFIADCFEQLATRQPRALVIDLRGNEGGLDVGDEILPHLIASELAIDEPPRLVRYRDVPTLGTSRSSTGATRPFVSMSASTRCVRTAWPQVRVGSLRERRISPARSSSSSGRTTVRRRSSSRSRYGRRTSVRWSEDRPAETCAASTAAHSSSCDCRDPAWSSICP
jgi:hypothetical protein